MKKLCVIFCFFISSLYSCDDNQQNLWLSAYKQRSNPQLREILLQDLSVLGVEISQYVKDHVSQAKAMKKHARVYDQILLDHQKMGLLSVAAAHENQAFSIHCSDLQVCMLNICAKISKELGVDLRKDRSIKDLISADYFFDDVSVDSNSDIKSVSSMTESTSSRGQSSNRSSLIATTKETISYISAVKSSMQSPNQSIAKSESDAISGLTKFQARFRGGVIRDNLSQIQAKAQHQKDAQKDAVQKLAQRRVDEENAKKIIEQKRLFLEQQQRNLHLKNQEQQEKLNKFAQNLENKKNEEEFVLQQAIEGHMLESLSQAQYSTLDGLSSKDKKRLKPFQKSIKYEFFNSSGVDENIAIDRLKPIVMEYLQKEGIHQGLSNWLVRSAVHGARQGFDLCVQDCGKSFDGMQVLSRIVQPSVGQDRLNQLKGLNNDKNLQLSDGQIHQVMEIEKQLLLGSFALQYKKSLLQPYTLLIKNNCK